MEKVIQQPALNWRNVGTAIEAELRDMVLNNLAVFIYWYDEVVSFDVHKWFVTSYQPELIQRFLATLETSATNEQTMRMFLQRQISSTLDKILREMDIAPAIAPTQIRERNDKQSWRYDS